MSEKLRKKLNNWIKTLDSKVILRKDVKKTLWSNKDFQTEGQLNMAIEYLTSLGYEVIDKKPIKKKEKKTTKKNKNVVIKKESDEQDIIKELESSDEIEEIDADLLDELITKSDDDVEVRPISTDSLTMYLRDLDGLDTSTLTQEQETDLINRAKAGDSFAWDDIIYHNTKLVINIASKYRNRATGVLGYEDLIQEGNIGLMKAVELFDTSLGFKFSTYATWWIKQRILRSLSNDSRTIRLPVHLVEIALAIRKIQANYYDIHETNPSDEWVAHYMNENEILKNSRKQAYTAQDIRKIQDYWNNQTLVSLAKPVGEDEDSTLGDFIPSEILTPEENTEKQFMREDLLKAINLVLNDREIKVIRYRFGLDGNKPLKLEDVGNILGVSRERIRQIESKALRKLARRAEVRSLRVYLEEYNHL